MLTARLAREADMLWYTGHSISTTTGIAAAAANGDAGRALRAVRRRQDPRFALSAIPRDL